MVADRLRRYRDSGVTTLQAKLDGDRTARLDTLAQLVELAAAVSRERQVPASGDTPAAARAPGRG
jgi:hypothetical protein